MSAKASPDAVPLIERLAPGAVLNSAGVDLHDGGLVEDEFILSGTAGRYRLTDPCRDAEWVDGGHRYRTRLLVRRPRVAAQFSGTVVVEWLNVSCGQDLDFVYAATRELISRAGHAWVGVSVQRVGVERLLSARPERYAELGVDAPTEDPIDGTPLDVPHPLTGVPGTDVLAWDIFSDVARFLRSPSMWAMGLPPVGRLVAAGESQSAIRLSHYFNSFQPVQRLYDGFLLYDRAGPMALRADVSAPCISVGTAFFAELAGGCPADEPNQRWWELAGASHVSLAEMRDYIDPQVLHDGLQQMDGQAVTLSTLLDAGHTGPKGRLWSRVPNGDLMKAALHGLERWITSGIAPPAAPRLLLEGPRKLRRDAQGQSMGGIRYAAVEVPVGRNDGVGLPGMELAGNHLDFDAAEMVQRYGHPAAYVARVEEVVASNLAEGFLLLPEAERVLAEARAVRFKA